MIGRVIRPLDRYVFGEFWKIFVVTGLGFPFLLIVIDLADNMQKYLEKRIPISDLLLSYVYGIPESMFLVLPAAVLFATVFSVGSFTRYSEITAAKASGISFYRFILPILFGAVFACGLDLVLGELSPITNQRKSRLLREDPLQSGTSRFNFVFAGENGRVYKAIELRTDSGWIERLQIERKGRGPTYPSYIMDAERARYSARDGWRLTNGSLDVIVDTNHTFTMTFASARDEQFTERPMEMMSRGTDPKNMRYKEITRYIKATERSGSDANLSRVERALKLAVPATCIIIALFGAPLATSTQRGGSAYGVAVSLATTMIFLLMIQLTRAIGSKAVIPPDYAAWVPGALFGVIGLVLLARVRT